MGDVWRVTRCGGTERIYGADPVCRPAEGRISGKGRGDVHGNRPWWFCDFFRLETVSIFSRSMWHKIRKFHLLFSGRRAGFAQFGLLARLCGEGRISEGFARQPRRVDDKESKRPCRYQSPTAPVKRKVIFRREKCEKSVRWGKRPRPPRPTNAATAPIARGRRFRSRGRGRFACGWWGSRRG